MNIIRKKIFIQGIVQGVGFRPFIYRLATSLKLTGFVYNQAQGVDILIQGAEADIDKFLIELESNPPILSHITKINHEMVPIHKNENKFFIQESKTNEHSIAFVSPDVAICPDCKNELLDPNDRRMNYPFINCTHCGPRYSLIRSMPYDRPNTTMAQFQMCPNCEEEYINPQNRRFHAQPVACPACGPTVQLCDRKGDEVLSKDPIKHTIQLLRAGNILAIKGIGGFHLACDATNDNAVQTLRKCKHRIEKPFAMMMKDMDVVEQFVYVSDNEKKILLSPVAPIVLLKKKGNQILSDSVEMNQKNYGIMLPYTPLHLLLFDEDLKALVMTSGNLSDEAIVIDNANAINRLSRIADYFLFHNREILARCDDSVIQIVKDKPRVIRRSRGIAPLPIKIPKMDKQILAVGGMTKNTICFTRNDQAFLSPHIGDLETLETSQFFEQSIQHMKRLFEFEPEMIACDMHPEYYSTQWAIKQKTLPVVQIQHHEAHIASCLAENQINEPVVGLAMDGTGYGRDGQIWGGEIFVGDITSLKRMGHFEYVPFISGDQIIYEPWRMTVCHLYHYFYSRFESDALFFKWIQKFPGFLNISSDKLMIIIQQLKHPEPLKTSSLGRLFDAISALTGICPFANFDGQPAMLLEANLSDISQNEMEWSTAYPFQIISKEGKFIIQCQLMWVHLVRDISSQLPLQKISLRFHMGLVRLFKDICIQLYKNTGIKLVVLSGGCFQNNFLLEHTIINLANSGFDVYSHSSDPCNDGGLSLGQAVLAKQFL